MNVVLKSCRPNRSFDEEIKNKMGVDLNIWALDKSNKIYTVFSLEKTSGSWDDIKRLEHTKVPADLWAYEAYEFYDHNAANKKGPGRRSGKRNLDVRKRKVISKELSMNAYGHDLISIKAIYLKILASDDSIRFETAYNKELFLGIEDDVDVVLYWH